MPGKTYITSGQLLQDAQLLAFKILDSGFHPELIIGIWRGGTPVGIAVQEILELAGQQADHIAIRTRSYHGIGQRGKVRVDGLEYIARQLREGLRILLIDDIHDTGLSLQAVIAALDGFAEDALLDIRIATPYYKPGNNQTQRQPDFFVHQTDDWLVFPHELIGLSTAEIMEEKPEISAIRERLKQITSK